MNSILLTNKVLSLIMAGALIGTTMIACKDQTTQSDQPEPQMQRSEQYDQPTQSGPSDPGRQGEGPEQKKQRQG